MFGYVRPILDQLSTQQREAYRSVYCGLCHTMGRRHGWPTRFTLNYDFTLLALLKCSCVEGKSVCLRCPVHPLRKPRACLCGEPMETAADESLILTWYKLGDDIADHGVIGGLPARILRRMFRRGYRKAAQARPEFDRSVCREMEKLHTLEAQRSPQLDRAADTFARILSAAADDCDMPCSDKRAMEQLLYHLGRWIYLVDAWDDLEDDRKCGRYNPLDSRFSGHAKEERDYIETTMTHSIRMIQAAANLLEFGEWSQITENILCSGLPIVQRAVLDGRWKELRRQRRTKNERSV